MTRCPKCGKESPDQARFCRFCGGKLGLGAEAAASADAALSPEQRAQRLLEEAFRLSEQGRILAAIQTCQQAILLTPQSTSTHSLLGTLYERQGDREKAIREYEQVLTLSPESTVERRRLNELMGVPTAREPVTVSPRTARLAITGAFVVLVLIAFTAFTLTRPSQPREETKPRLRSPAGSDGRAVSAAEQSPMLPSPGRTFLQPRMGSFPPPLPLPARTQTWSAQAPAPATGGATYLGPGAYLYPSSGGERYYAGLQSRPAPLAGAQPYRGTPVVAGAPWTGAVSGGGTQTARDYYLQGDYQRAATTYQTYLNQHPGAGGAPKEELGWVYLQMGERDRAQQAYRSALGSYQTDLERGHNTEAARHGLRTCESAIKALEAR